MQLDSNMLQRLLLIGLISGPALANTGRDLAETKPVPASLAEELATLETEDQSATFTMDSKGFRVTSADGKSSIKIGGRIQADVSFHSPDSTDDGTEFSDGTELRRGRFELKGTLPEHMFWAAEVDFATNVTGVKDFWLGIDRPTGPKIMFGNQKQPYSLAVEMSSNDLPFLERSVDIYLLAPFLDRAVGLRIEDSTENFYYAWGVFGEGVTPQFAEDEGVGTTARLIAAPIQSDDRVLHLGARGAYRIPSGNNRIRIRDETTNMSDYRVVDTGFIFDVDNVAIYGGEASYVHGPFSLGGEYSQVSVSRTGEDFDFTGWHVEGTYTITGESRAKAYNLKSGEFKRLKAEHGKALELAARFATIDLNDGSLSGGAQDVGALELNWYTGPNTRLMFGWSRILNTSGGTSATSLAEDTDIFAGRLQLTF